MELNIWNTWLYLQIPKRFIFCIFVCFRKEIISEWETLSSDVLFRELKMNEIMFGQTIKIKDRSS